MSDVEKSLKPEVVVFAGPNGSGKSTITKMAKTVGVYINADDIKSYSVSGIKRNNGRLFVDKDQTTFTLI